MTMNDKPKRPGSKPFAGDKKTTKRDGAKPAKVAAVKAADATAVEDGKAERISKVMARAGVASRRDENRRLGLSLCERAGAIITATETVAFDLLGQAGTDAFKAVSKLVR